LSINKDIIGSDSLVAKKPKPEPLEPVWRDGSPVASRATALLFWREHWFLQATGDLKTAKRPLFCAVLVRKPQ